MNHDIKKKGSYGVFASVNIIQDKMIKKEKIKEIWNKVSYEIQNVFLKYPFTMSIIIILTLLCIIFINRSEGIIPEYVMPFLGWLGVGIYFCESVFRNKLPLKAAGMLAAAAISILLVYHYHNYYKNISIAVPDDIWFARINIAYIIVCVLLGIYYCYRKSGYLLPQYGIRVFSNLIKTHIIFYILSSGALVIGVIIEELFFSGNYDSDMIGRMLILVVGFFYVPSCIYSFSETDSRIDVFSKILVKYILFPLTMLIFSIIYLYVLKILILMDMPSNQIFAIVTGLFILAAPTWTMMESLEGEQWWYRISRRLPILFVPFILLQVYSIGVRIRQYGITPDRYMGVMWIVLEIIYMAVYFIRHRYAGRIFAIIAGAVVFSLLIPGVNMYRMSITSQERIMSLYKKNEELSDKEKNKIYGAYEYLQDVSGSEKYIEKYSSEEIAEIKGFYNGEDDRYDSSEIKIGIDSYVSDFDISEYNQMQVVRYEEMNYGDPEPDLSRLKLTRRGSEDEVITVNLQEIIENYVNYGIENIAEDGYYITIDSYYMEHNQINLGEDSVLFIRDFEIEYDKETEKVIYLELTAYLFQ